MLKLALERQTDRQGNRKKQRERRGWGVVRSSTFTADAI